jgi:hypothetical protein
MDTLFPIFHNDEWVNFIKKIRTTKIVVNNNFSCVGEGTVKSVSCYGYIKVKFTLQENKADIFESLSTNLRYTVSNDTALFDTASTANILMEDCKGYIYNVFHEFNLVFNACQNEFVIKEIDVLDAKMHILDSACSTMRQATYYAIDNAFFPKT